MKKLIYVLSIAILLTACKDEPKDYVTLSGKITDKNSDSLIISTNEYRKNIKVDEDGTFSDTLKIETGRYRLTDGKKSTTIYLENGYELRILLDTKNFHENASFTGVGADVNNFLREKTLLENELIMNSALFNLEKEAFDQKLKEFDSNIKKILIKLNITDSTFIKNQNKENEQLKKYFLSKYEDNQFMANSLYKGKVSPKFVDYENINGKSTSLEDLRGSYVFISIWSAKMEILFRNEIPYLKLLKNEYIGKNIVFAFISIDRKKDYDIWKKSVLRQKLGGVQLFAKEDKSFINSYNIKSTPRFILIDPSGNIVSANAPRPSSNGLKELFDSLKL